MPISVFGQRIVIPQAIAKVFDEDMAPLNAAYSGILAILGSSRGGEPQKVHWIRTAAEARAIFGSGDLVEAVTLATAPSPDGAGAGLMAVIRVEAATQSTLDLVATATPIITLDSADYGIHTEAIRAKFTAGAGKWTCGVRYNDAEVTGDIVGEAFTIEYTGIGTPAVINIDDTGITTTCTGASDDDLDIPWTQFTNIYDLVQFIDDHPNYTCTLDHPESAANPQDLLDFVTDGDITTAYTAPSVVYDAVNWFNQKSGGLIVASFVGGLTDKTAPDDTSPEWSQLTGGTTPAAVTGDWDDGLELLEAENVNIIVAYTATDAVQDAVLAHCAAMSAMQMKKNRICVTGSIASETKTAALTRAATFNNRRLAYVWPGLKLRDYEGNLVTYPGWRMAAAVAGMLAGVDATTPLTKRYVTAQGIETQATPADIESLLLGGVLPIRYIKGRGYQVVQSITSYTGDLRYNYRELSGVRGEDLVVLSVLDVLEEQIVGKKGGTGLQARAIQATTSMLDMLYRQGHLVGDEASPPYQFVTAQLSGETMTVSFEFRLALPVNYVVVQMRMKVYEGTMTA